MTSAAAHPPRDYRMMVLLAFGIVLFANSALIGWGWWLAVQRATVELSEPIVQSSSTALCPGDALDYVFVMGVSKAADIELKTSEQRLTPGARISFARFQEFKFTEPTTLEFVRHWIVPPQYTEPVTGSGVPWEPGDYEQITVANVVGRSEIAEVKVKFSIKEGC